MRTKSMSSSSQRRPRAPLQPNARGLSLLEVMCAVVILGTILASAMFAVSRAQRHLALLERKSQALAGLEMLLSGQAPELSTASRGAGPNPIPESLRELGTVGPPASGGLLPGSAGLTWTSQTRTELADELELTIARIDVHDKSDAIPLASVEVVVSAKITTPAK